MELIYRQSESNARPKPLEENYGTMYIRKSINEERRYNGDGTYQLMWVYLEATIPTKEYVKYKQDILILNVDETNDNQMVAMDAIADIYETIATLQETQFVLMEAIADIFEFISLGGK